MIREGGTEAISSVSHFLGPQLVMAIQSKP